MMADCTESTKRDFPFESQFLLNLAGIYLEIFDLVEKRPIKSMTKIAQLIVSAKNFRFLDSASDQIFNGYYEVGMSLLRNVYENNLLTKYLQNKEAESEAWLQRKLALSQKDLRRKLGNQIHSTNGCLRGLPILREVTQLSIW
jgi:hypothetical protein